MKLEGRLALSAMETQGRRTWWAWSRVLLEGRLALSAMETVSPSRVATFWAAVGRTTRAERDGNRHDLDVSAVDQLSWKDDSR